MESLTLEAKLARPAMLLLLGALLLATGCRSNKESPEDQVRKVMGVLQKAAAEADVKTLKGFISERYGDSTGNDRAALSQLLSYHYLRHRTQFVFSSLLSVEQGDGEHVTAVAVAAMVGQPIAEASELKTIDADILRFTFRFHRTEDGWRCLTAVWQRASPADFL